MPSVEDYLTKQIYIDKNVVTFRSLSRQFKLHVNAAKNQLAKFHNNSMKSETRSFATYLVSGELFRQTRSEPPATQTEDGMEVDSEVAEEDNSEDGEETPVITMTLVGENDLERAKSRYARIFSTHVYCLSPAPLTDAGLICEPAAIVYKADAKDAPTSSVLLGRVVGPDVRIGKVPPPVASSSKAAQPMPRKPMLKAKVEEPPAQVSKKEKDKEKEKTPAVKPKASGKLDWSKAKKPSDNDRNRHSDANGKKKIEETQPAAPKVKSEKPSPKSERDISPRDDSKRGTKRKAAPPPPSDSEVEVESKASTPAPAKAEVKIRKNRIVSDDEDEDERPVARPKPKGRSRTAAAALESAEEASLRAMMDMDDSQVEKASTTRLTKSAPKEPEDEDIVMESEPEPVETQQYLDEDMDEDEPKPKRKRKPKKVWPVGRNGLKKKRITKTRMSMDAKGYMVTEDYSEYESVDEEEVEEVSQKKPKAKKATTAKPKKSSDDEPAPPPKSKPVARTGSIKAKGSSAKLATQGSLKDFFGKPKK